MIRYRGGYKYQLAEPYSLATPILPQETIITPFLCLTALGNLYINGGYAWDGATFFPDVKSIMRGSLVHDAFYQLMRLGYLGQEHRHAADKMLYQYCVEDGMTIVVAWGVYQGVRIGGGSAADPRNAKPLLVAP